MAVSFPDAIAQWNGSGIVVTDPPTAATTANSGGAAGTAFSGVQATAPSSVAYVKGLRGNVAVRTLGSASVAQFRWDQPVVGSRTFLYGTDYITPITRPTGYTAWLDLKRVTGSSAVSGRLSIGATGFLRVAKSDLTTAATATSGALSLGVEYRVEWWFDCPTGKFRVTWYVGESTVPMGELASPAAGTKLADGETPAFGTVIEQVIRGRLASPDHTMDFNTFGIGAVPLGRRADRPKEATLGLYRGNPQKLYRGKFYARIRTGKPIASPTADPRYRTGFGLPVWEDTFDYIDPVTGDPAIDPGKWQIWDYNRVQDGTMPSTLGTLNDGGIVRGGRVKVITTEDGSRAAEISTIWRDTPISTAAGPLSPDNPTNRWMDTGYMDQRNINGANRQRFGRWEWEIWIPDLPDKSLGMLWALWLRNGKSGEWDVSETWGSGPAAAGSVPPGPGVLYPRAKQPKPNAGTSTNTIHRNTNGGNTRVAYTHSHATPLFGRWTKLVAIWTPDLFEISYDGIVKTSLRPGDAASKFPLASAAIDGGVVKDLWTAPELDSPWYMRFNVHPGPSTLYYGMPDPTHREWTAPSSFRMKSARVWALAA